MNVPNRTRYGCSWPLLLIIFAACSLPAQTPLVNHGDAWRYHKGTSAPQSNWKTVADASLDASWLSGNGGFGYADNGPETQLCQTILGDMINSYTTVYMRKQFTIASSVATTQHLFLTMDFDDGFIAWLDGTYLTNQNVTGAPAEPSNTAVANTLHESSHGSTSGVPPAAPAITTDLGAVGARLGVGTHTLAIIGLNQAITSSDLIQVADLSVAPPPVPITNYWRLVNSPIIVPTNVTIGANATLIIEPGVTVDLGSGIDITVAGGGKLLAGGTSNARIHFTRSGASGYWGHITINGSVGSPESRIAYALLDFNANDPNTPCIEVAAGTAYLDHLTFGNNGAPYIHVDGASFIISDCVFPSGAVKFELCHGTGGIKSGGHGIFLRNFFGTTVGYADVVDFTGGKRPSPIVHFINNVLTGSQDDGLDIDGTDAWIEGNIFMHVHRNGDTPDSSSAVSGGNNSGNTSDITIVGNLFFDCDNAVTAKQGNFYTLLNNTIVHTTKTGGIDGASGVVCIRDTTPSVTTFGLGCYLEGNIIQDAEQLVRNYDAAQTTVTLNNNILPFAWNGPGSGNSITNPLLAHIPLVSETVFANWAQAQIMRTWFGLQPGSSAIGSGPNGRDKGGAIPLGASIFGEPPVVTIQSNATLVVGIVRAGNGIPVSGWPSGSGFTHYKWRLDTNAWSAERPIATPITLTGLAQGPHYVEVSGKRDSGLYQDDPLFGLVAGVTRSRTWTVVDSFKIDQITITGSNSVQLQFTAQANIGYTIQYRNSLTTGAWQPLALLDPIGSVHQVNFTDTLPPGTPMRFYRLATR